MDADIYKAAANGDIEMFMNNVENLPFLLTPSKNTALHINITAQIDGVGSTEFVEKILDLCPSLLLQPNIKGETLLHIAARNGLDAVVETLLQRAESHDFDNYHQELESGISAASQMVRMMNKHKETALHEAVRYHQFGAVQLLTKADRNFPYFANEAGETPLYLAVERGYHDMVFEILATCTSPAHDGPNGRKSLHAAVIINDGEIMRKLIEIKGSLIGEVDNRGWTPLHYAANLGYAPLVKLLLHYDPSTAYIGDRDGKKIALHVAASRGHIDVMMEILSCCPDCCELVDNRGLNVFHFTLKSNNDQAVKFILQNSSLCSIINEEETNGSTTTPLRWLALEMGGNYLSAPDIFLSNAMFSGIMKDEIISSSIEEQHVEDDHTKLDEQVRREPDATSESWRLKDLKGTQLIIATLIATVTFTAGFTMPGGLNNNEGPMQGAAILTGSKAFRAFIITNTIAMGRASSSVACHIFMERHNQRDKPEDDILSELLTYTFSSLVCMVIAFITGTYAVLEHSSAFGIGIAICIAGGFLIFSLCISSPNWIGPSKHE